MITHYGLFWSERDVFWGRGRVKGELLGREKTPLDRKGAPTKQERAKSKCYREFVGLYCLYGEGELIYVGEAGLGTKSTIFDRLKRHRKGGMADRWDSFSWFGRANTQGNCANLTALQQLEAISIAIINPGFNRQNGTFADATQFFQMPHERSEGDLETKLERLRLQIEMIAAAVEDEE